MFVIVVNLFAEIPFGWWGMITGLGMMSRLQKCLKQWKQMPAFQSEFSDKLPNHFLGVNAKGALKNFSCDSYSHKVFVQLGIVFNRIRPINISIHIFGVLI